MKLTVSKYELVKTLIEGVEIELPEEIFYWQDWNYRVLWMVLPKFTTWNVEHYQKPEELYQYEIVKLEVENKAILTTTVNVDVNTLEKFIRDAKKANTPQERMENDVLTYVTQYFGNDKVSAETFNKYYKSLFNRFDKLIEQPKT